MYMYFKNLTEYLKKIHFKTSTQIIYDSILYTVICR